MSERTFVVPEEGDVVVHSSEPTSASAERIQDILVMIEDPDQSLSEINKRIAMEIAHISADIAKSAVDVSRAYMVKPLAEQVKALRELSKTLVEAEALSKRDILNFDGPKFQFVLGELVKLYKKSLIQASMTESQANDVLKLFRDLLAVYEPVLRKETDRITGIKN